LICYDVVRGPHAVRWLDPGDSTAGGAAAGEQGSSRTARCV